VTSEEQILISDLMYECFQELKTDKQVVFDKDKFDFIDDTFKTWFAFYNNDQFKQICNFVKVSKPKYVGVFLCKLCKSLSNKQLAFLFGVNERTIANYVNLAREDLLENLVPKFLNNNRIDQLQYLWQKCSSIFEKIKLAVYLTLFRFAQKSKNFSEQMQLWGTEKNAVYYVIRRRGLVRALSVMGSTHAVHEYVCCSVVWEMTDRRDRGEEVL